MSRFNYFYSLSFITVFFLNATFLQGQVPFGQNSMFDVMNYREVIPVTLEADFAAIDSSRREKIEQEAQLTFENEEGIVQTWDVKLKVRGKFRRINCEMPPLKIDFSKKDLKGAGLARFDDIKLVTHCAANKEEAKALLQKEYLAYKLYNELTEFSYRVQLLKITYKDISTGSEDKRWAFLIEDTAQLKDRIGAVETIENVFNLPRDTFHDGLLKIASVYQYMIGNSDWSIKTGKNIKYISRNGKVIPVPYDFDFSGLVNAPYAIPNPNYGISSIRTRIFLGFPEDAQQLTSTLSYFKLKRNDLFRTVENFNLLDRDSRVVTIDYLNSFYASMNEITVGERDVLSGVNQVAAIKKK